MDGSFLNNTNKKSKIPPPHLLNISNQRQTSTPSVQSSIYPHFSSPNDSMTTSKVLTIPLTPDLSNKENTEDIISYQRIKKVITKTNETSEAALKIKEEYLMHLKSIDLKKYSFPNENKPKTDYTYAKTSSYRSQDNADDINNDVMPNLCRRARSPKILTDSPKKPFVLNQIFDLFSSKKSPKSVQLSKTNQETNRPVTRAMSSKKTAVLENLYGLDSDKSSSNSTPYYKNLFFSNTVKRGQDLIAAGSNKIANLRKSISGKIESSTPAKAEQRSIATMTVETTEIQVTPLKKRSTCWWLPLFFAFFVLLAAILQHPSAPATIEKLSIEYINPGWTWIQTNSRHLINESIIPWFTYLSDLAFKLGNNRTVQSSHRDDLIDETRLIDELNELKEKIIQETITNLKSVTINPTQDMDLIRSELDNKFNYTLSLMSRQLADQSKQFERSAKSHENEIRQMRAVIDELESRYNKILNKLQDENPKIDQNYVSFHQIEKYIEKTFRLYNADKTGMTDFASESIGGSILFTRCTEAYKDNSRWFTVFDVPITRITVSPRVVIQGSHLQPGNCWAFKGSKADLFIKLAARIRALSFSIEHIPKELSLTGTIDSAPQNFTIYGYSSVDEINDDSRLLLGNFRYDNTSSSTLQFFKSQHQYEKPIAAIELKIESNAGNSDYTCLYKFRVHGELFKTNKLNQASNENKIDSEINN